MAKKQKVSVVGWTLSIEYPTIGKTFKADLTKYSEPMREELQKHGAKQKFGDAESGGTAQEKYEMVQRIHDGLMAGQWELTSNYDMTPLIIEAVHIIKKIPMQKLLAAAEKHPEQVKEWGTSLKVKAWIATKRAKEAEERAKEAEEIQIDLT